MAHARWPSFSCAIWACACALTFTGIASAQTLAVPNPSFEQGQDAPLGWTLSGGEGAWIDDAADGNRAVAVTGNGTSGDNNYWRSENLPLEPSTLYRLQFRARRIQGTGGCPTSGPVFCNRDLSGLGDGWTRFTSMFVTPKDANPNEMWLRFGQWEIAGTVAYDGVALVRAQPIYRAENGLILGEGESIDGAAYAFDAPLRTGALNFSRPLAHHRCQFNAPRWVFGADSEVVYRHRIGDFKQTAAQVEIKLNLHSAGRLVVEVGTDGQTWREIGSASEQTQMNLDIPADLLPAEEIWVRLGSKASRKVGQDSDPGSFQVNAYAYKATLDGEAGALRGRTSFVTETETDPRLKVTIETFGEAVPGGDNVLVATIENTSNETIAAAPCLTLTPPDGPGVPTASAIDLAPGTQEIRLPYEITATGAINAAFTLGENIPYRAETAFDVAHLFDSSYGALLPDSTGAVGLWWASSGWKISRTRAMPTKTSSAMQICAAKNEVEAAQLVVRPAQEMKAFVAESQPLTGPGGALIPARNVELLRVRYVPVAQPTDDVGVVAPWPDPLPPFTEPIDLAANEHQPIWVRVKVPRDTPAGDYQGVIRLMADGYAAQVPLHVEVFDFVLPDRMTCTTAFGFSASLVFRYHNLTEPEQRRQVYDKYLATLGAHHISPYNPAALDPFQVHWPKIAQWQGGVRDTEEKHGGQGALVLVDDSDKKSASAEYDALIPIPENGLRLRFWYKTKDPGQWFIVTLHHHDANGQWLYGKNNDIRIQGDGSWQHFDQAIDQFPEGAKAFRFKLWAALYAEDDSTQGTVWYDDLVMTDAGGDKELIAGDFEPLSGDDLDGLKPEFDWAAWDTAMTKAVDQFHFNTFRLPIQGMGGGTFHARHEPSLMGYREDTPEYQAAFAAYCQGVQEHLREKGWLDEAFVYWFDEPSPKDYAFVTNGFLKLKNAAPDIARMLTEQVEPELVGGPNIWCPLTPSFDLEVAQERRAQGEKFWWYICTGPKAPYVTLFIDHPATELRVWSWQTWKRRISGLLIWETNYWTSSAAYPDPNHPQNPYDDPMGWRTGYSTPPGVKMPWGNGDGRFIYPAEAAADGRPEKPVLDGPVDSIRFEMLRDGIEDHEYLAILDRLIREHESKLSPEDVTRYKQLLDVPEDISVDLTHFTTDPAPIEQRRAAVARAIETLARL